MQRTITYHISDEYEKESILGFLKSRGYSHAVITHLKRTENGILLNGSWARTQELLHDRDELTVTVIEHTSSENILPVYIPLHIVYEDQDLLVINKEAGMPIHPSQGNHGNTLANALVYYYSQKGESFTFRCINRLDRDTTGLLIVAKHMLSASLLSAMSGRREIHREYIAIAEGKVPDSGTIEAPIGRVDGSTIERRVDFCSGEYARTHYKRIAYKKGYSYVSLTLDTGRTHQIRVHMKHIGHPLPGDFLYHPDYKVIGRQALHSSRLAFCHPITGEKLSFTSPLPADMCL